MHTHNDKTSKKNNGQGRVWAGVIILGIGLVLLAGQLGMGYLFPRWLFSWPMILIIIGLMIGGSSNFKNPAALILIGIGTVFSLQRNFDFNIGKLIIPLFLTGLGVWLLIDKNKSYSKKNRFRKSYSTDWQAAKQAEEQSTYEGAESTFSESYSNTGNVTDNDFLNSTAIFSEEKKTVVSRNLQGGDIVNIFGGTDINLIQADIKGPIVIDIFQLFAGTKIIVPSNWRLHSKVVSVFGEVDDRRFIQEAPKDEEKIVYLKGTSIFGGITIKSI